MTTPDATQHLSRIRDVVVPHVSLPEYVLARVDRLGGRVALVDGVTGDQLTYRQLKTLVVAGARRLRSMGLRTGDVVGLLSPNQPAWAVAFHAVVAAGGVVTPLGAGLTAGEIRTQLMESSARLLIVADTLAGRGSAALVGTRVTQTLVIGPGEAGMADLVGPDAAMAAAATPVVDPAGLAALPFSSGTTGLPKGVMLTHHNLVANLEQFRPVVRITERDVLCAALPFSHIYGLTLILNAALVAGATVITLPRYDLELFLATIARYGVTRLHLVPPMVLDLAHRPEVDRHDLTTVRSAICGAAPLDEATARRAMHRLGCPIVQGYGMTEASPSTHITPDDEWATTPPSSIGRLMPGTRARLFEPGTDRAVQSVGEMWIRGPQVMAGYLDGAATASTVRDGWLRTGDLVRVDANGLFWVIDRIKELIKYNGYAVAPAELEALLLSHPQVRDAAVVRWPHAPGGEAPKAFVVPIGAVDPEELMSWVAARVAAYKKVRAVEFVATLPRSASGKLLRRELGGQIGEGSKKDIGDRGG